MKKRDRPERPYFLTYAVDMRRMKLTKWNFLVLIPHGEIIN